MKFSLKKIVKFLTRKSRKVWDWFSLKDSHLKLVGTPRTWLDSLTFWYRCWFSGDVETFRGQNRWKTILKGIKIAQIILFNIDIIFCNFVNFVLILLKEKISVTRSIWREFEKLAFFYSSWAELRAKPWAKRSDFKIFRVQKRSIKFHKIRYIFWSKLNPSTGVCGAG